jgi:CRP-like cAMP-binding protein
VYREGSETDGAYFVKSGEFQFTKQINGRTVYLSIKGANSVIGETNILDGSNRLATWTWISQSGEAYFMSKQDFEERIITKHTLKQIEARCA